MLAQYYTMDEIQHTKFYELPNCLYNRILADIEKALKIMTKRIVEKLNNAIVTELDQYCNIYQYIRIIH